MSPEEAVITLTFGLLVGFLSGLLGVGGGVVMVPYLVLVLGGTQHVAEGTSLLVIVPTALIGALTNARRGLVSSKVALGLGLGGIVGAFGGAQLALLLPTEVLTRLFAMFLFLIGARFVLQRRRGGADTTTPPGT